MALQKSVVLNSGVGLLESYIKISKILYSNISSTQSYVDITINIFNDKASRDALKPEVISFNYRVTDEDFDTYFSLNVLSQDGINIISQGYEYLKSLDFFSDSVDIIDIKE